MRGSHLQSKAAKLLVLCLDTQRLCRWCLIQANTHNCSKTFAVLSALAIALARMHLLRKLQGVAQMPGLSQDFSRGAQSLQLQRSWHRQCLLQVVRLKLSGKHANEHMPSIRSLQTDQKW